jgi:hypothetical protein
MKPRNVGVKIHPARTDKLSLIFLSVGTCLRSLSCHASQIHLLLRNASIGLRGEINMS